MSASTVPLAPRGRPLRVLFAISEAHPFVKVGGLGDVGAALPSALAALGHQVDVVLPAYPWLRIGRPVCTFQTGADPTDTVSVWHLDSGVGTTVYAVGSRERFQSEQAYGYEAHDVEPFIHFCRSVAALPAALGRTPDVLHCHDWHTGLLPRLVRSWCSTEGRSATVFTIHNAGYQGLVPAGLPEMAGADRVARRSFLHCGVAHADRVTTVSDTYLRELRRERGGGGFGYLLSARPDVAGIGNGIDYVEFDPAADAYIPEHFDASDLSGKRADKAALQRRSGLPVAPAVPVVGMVTRLVDHKGIGLVTDALPDLAARGVQVVVMGVGDERHRRALEERARELPNVAFHRTDDEGLARLVYAGSDLFLAPSMYEPFGMAPLIAMRYGAVPVVRRTGGLAETIQDYRRDRAHGVGFTFVRKYPETLGRTIAAALSVYRKQEEWSALQVRGMARRYSWQESALAYADVYREARETVRASTRATV